MYYTEFEGKKVYGFYYQSGEGEGLPDVASIMSEVITISGEMDNPVYYDATDLDGLSVYLLVVDGGLPVGTILEKVVYTLQDLEDPEYNEKPNPEEVEWESVHRRNVVQEDGTVREIW